MTTTSLSRHTLLRSMSATAISAPVPPPRLLRRLRRSPEPHISTLLRPPPRLHPLRYRLTVSRSPEDPQPPDGENPSFDAAVSLFNSGDYHRCHDVVEELWYVAEEPARTILHGLLQCAVGFHHLFNQNHRGAMMELGEGLCKLRKMGFESGPFLQFELEVSAALEFVYETQKELAACSDDLCLTMDGSDRSYQLLGSFAAGEQLYNLDIAQDGTTCIIFGQGHQIISNKPLRVKLPILNVTEEHLKTCEYR